jgi:ribosomal protein L28
VGWRYKAPHTARQFKPNLRNIDLEIDGVVKNFTICMKCYKRLQKGVEEKEA